jgi:CRISPR system Cascade subunit CasC
MSRFLQLHLLTFFPPANLNRDDTGRPKTAVVGGATRLRLSSQALKRAWRTSDAFCSALAGHMGQRTQRIGEVVLAHVRAGGMDEAKSLATAREIAAVFGEIKEIKDKDPAQIKQLAFISPEERAAALALADQALAGETIDAKGAGLLRSTDTAADIALFGRMLADSPSYNREAAAQVAHAITTHKVTVEDDYYTALDDLTTSADGAGAAFLGETAFGSGVFYLYLCVDRTLLVKNLGGDATLASTALGALARAAATVAPNGKQNNFAAHGRASYVLAERGDQQPRTLAGAFARPVTGDDLIGKSIEALDTFRTNMERAYGPAADATKIMQVGGSGALSDMVTFFQGGG